MCVSSSAHDLLVKLVNRFIYMELFIAMDVMEMIKKPIWQPCAACYISRIDVCAFRLQTERQRGSKMIYCLWCTAVVPSGAHFHLRHIIMFSWCANVATLLK